MQNEKFNKKDLKKRLACIMLIYMDNLDDAKKDRLRKYLESSLGDIIKYYMSLLKKKEIKRLVLPDLTPEIMISKLQSCAGDKNDKQP